MAVSQNGWTVYTTATSLVPLRWVTGRVAPGDVHTILDHLGERFNAEVEPIDRASSWGWANRSIRGATTISNHASGTAVDFNAPRHPLGAVGTFSTAQVKVIHKILDELGGVVRWGGDYSGRKDEMHFEINANAARVAEVARTLNSPQEDDMPLTDTEAKMLAEIHAAVAAIDHSVVKRRPGTPGALIHDYAKSAAINSARAAGLDIDEAAIIEGLRPILESSLSELGDADLAAIAQAVNDEADRRQRERLGS